MWWNMSLVSPLTATECSLRRQVPVHQADWNSGWGQAAAAHWGCLPYTWRNTWRQSCFFRCGSPCDAEWSRTQLLHSAPLLKAQKCTGVMRWGSSDPTYSSGGTLSRAWRGRPLKCLCFLWRASARPSWSAVNALFILKDFCGWSAGEMENDTAVLHSQTTFDPLGWRLVWDIFIWVRRDLPGNPFN